MKKKLIILSIGLIPTTSFFSQDQSFSPTAGNNVSINPALAGNGAHARISSTYRNQWPSLTGSYLTSSSNFYQYIPKLNGFGGITFTNQNQFNTIQKTKATAFYSQNITIGELLIRPAVEVGFGRNSIDVTKVTFGDMIDPNQGVIYSNGDAINSTRDYLDLNAGAIVYYKNFLIGVSAHHLNKPNTSLINDFPTNLPSSFGAQFSYNHTFNKIGLSPYVTFNTQNKFHQTIIGLRAMYNNHLNATISMTNRNGVIAGLGYQSKLFSLTYFYDVTVSRLNNGVTGGSHQVSLFFNIWKLKTSDKLVEINSVFN